MDELLCLADGTTICLCDTDTSEWTSTQCADVCGYNNMSGDQCIVGEDGPTCNCSYDCQDATAVAAQCDDGSYTPCTCGAADPCSWQGDDYCDIACAEYFPEDHFDDAVDCTCEGTCDAETFAGYCLGATVCGCNDGAQAITQCSAVCGELGAQVAAEPPCAEGSCNCDNFDCDNTAAVQLACDNGFYTPCTCGVANPCSWIGDDFCDTPNCNEIYPGQTNFDDTATDCG